MVLGSIVGRVPTFYSRHTYDNPVKICLFQIVKSFYPAVFFSWQQNKNFARLTKLKSIWERWQELYGISRKLISYAEEPSRIRPSPAKTPRVVFFGNVAIKTRQKSKENVSLI